jgi:hypothetical protein
MTEPNRKPKRTEPLVIRKEHQCWLTSFLLGCTVFFAVAGCIGMPFGISPASGFGTAAFFGALLFISCMNRIPRGRLLGALLTLVSSYFKS